MTKKTIVTNIVIAIAVLGLLFSTVGPILFGYSSTMIKSLITKLDEDISTKDKDEAQFAKQFFTLIQTHNLEAAKKLVDPEIANELNFNENLAKMAVSFPNETPKSVKFVGTKRDTTDSGLSSIAIVLEYEFSNKWVLASVILQKQDKNFVVFGTEVQSMRDALENKTTFKFLGRGVNHYAVFTAAMLIVLLDCYALALCIKEIAARIKSPKPWLWMVFVLIGFERVNFDWLNGTFNLGAYTSFRFPVAGISVIIYHPFIITLTIPLGAILFLLKRQISQRRLVPA